MAKQLKTRHLHHYLLHPPQDVDEHMWQADVELMSVVEEAAQLEAKFQQVRVHEHRSHALQWGRETEQRLRSRLWVVLNLMEMEGRYGPAMESLRRRQRYASPS